MTTQRDHAERLRRNDESRNRANHHAEPWTGDELDMLFDEWGKSPIEDIAEVLGRTIEACRQRYYETRQGKSHSVTTKTVTTTTVEHHHHYIGAADDEDDCFWSPDYYTKGK